MICEHLKNTQPVFSCRFARKQLTSFLFLVKPDFLAVDLGSCSWRDHGRWWWQSAAAVWAVWRGAAAASPEVEEGEGVAEHGWVVAVN
jgi:hypothetical protein